MVVIVINVGFQLNMHEKRPSPKKVYIKTFGCQMNEYDSDKMFDVLSIKEPMIKVGAPEEADIILFNTCSIREKAQEKVFSDLGSVRAIKDKNPQVIIGVGGCVASQEGEVIIKRAAYVDVVFGPQAQDSGLCIRSCLSDHSSPRFEAPR